MQIVIDIDESENIATVRMKREGLNDRGLSFNFEGPIIDVIGTFDGSKKVNVPNMKLIKDAQTAVHWMINTHVQHPNE